MLKTRVESADKTDMGMTLSVRLFGVMFAMLVFLRPDFVFAQDFCETLGQQTNTALFRVGNNCTTTDGSILVPIDASEGSSSGGNDDAIQAQREEQLRFRQAQPPPQRPPTEAPPVPAERPNRGGGQQEAVTPGSETKKTSLMEESLKGTGLGEEEENIGASVPDGIGSASKVVQAKAAAELNAVRSMVSECESASSTTANDCSSEKSDDALSNAMSVIDSATNAINSGGAAYACGQVNTAAQVANAAMTGVKATCSASFGNCQKACSKSPSSMTSTASSELDTLKARFSAARNKCYTASQKVAGIDQNIAQLQAAQARAGQCQADAAAQAALASGGTGLSQQCQLNPNLPICSGSSASIPSFSSSRGSVGGSGSAGRAGAGLDGDYGSNGDLPGGGDLGGPFGTGGDPLNPNAQAANGPGQLPPPDGGGGMGGGSGKGANKAEAPGKPTRVPSKINTSVLAGSYGTRMGAFAPANGEPGSYSPNGSWIPPKVGPNPLAHMNLDKFRPQMKGYRMPSTDGNHVELLASHVNIWKQMNLRYQSLKTSLMP